MGLATGSTATNAPFLKGGIVPPTSLLILLLLSIGLSSFEVVPSTIPPSKANRWSKQYKHVQKKRIFRQKQCMKQANSKSTTALWGVLGLVGSILTIVLMVIGLGVSSAATLLAGLATYL